MTQNSDMLERLARLRNLGVHRGPAGITRPKPPRKAPDQLPGQPVETPFGSVWLRSERFVLTEHGELGGLLDVSSAALAGLGRDSELDALLPGGCAFLDTETTGLGTGPGTYAFLVGVGGYETVGANGEPSGTFVVRQYFMRHPGEERALLYLLDEV